MSQEDMALELHMSISNVSRLESNKYELKAADLFKWLKITNNPDVLMALYASIDVATSLMTSGATSAVTGAIIFLGGIL
ncbi:helix-turn-helix transcriptional regulator [Virgibacillus halophilus]|uniref:Helix-turn-helix transcriptional regulator n=2 Tax=Tigheibacillus halophilus TaxID=361280 RepID=A0ABU5C7S9_9BACI|nr:helix-turn-helix transcriptional regulator [Virgibacillus halophilus]